MKNRSFIIEDFFLSLYKVSMYFLLYLTFIFVFKRVNYALVSLTRTFVITTSAFFLVILMMTPVYGNFEIGKEKSKPVFMSTMITMLFTNVLAFITLAIMGINEFPIKDIILPGLLSLIVTYIIQGVIIWVMAHVGNDLYFKVHKPSKTIIISNNDSILKKIEKYVVSYDKQYKLEKIYKNPRFEDLNFNHINTIYLIDAEYNFKNKMIEYCFKNDISLIYNADTSDLLISKTDTEIIDDLLVVPFHPKRFTLSQIIIKRLIDVIGSLLFIIVSFPLWIIIGIAIKLEDGGPIIYKQDRLTLNHRKFKIYKFRSMKVNSGYMPAKEKDSRITKVGNFIRKYRIDELPQFINILKGEMSLVGPRAESVERFIDIEKELKDFDLRLRVKAGLTGYAQIFGKYNTTPENKLLLDIKYIENFSILEDIKLLFQTVIVFIKSDSTEGFSEDNIL